MQHESEQRCRDQPYPPRFEDEVTRYSLEAAFWPGRQMREGSMEPGSA